MLTPVIPMPHSFFNTSGALTPMPRARSATVMVSSIRITRLCSAGAGSGTAGHRRALGDLDPRRQRDHGPDGGTRRIARGRDRWRRRFLGDRFGDRGCIGRGTLGRACAGTFELDLEPAASATGDLL